MNQTQSDLTSNKIIEITAKSVWEADGNEGTLPIPTLEQIQNFTLPIPDDKKWMVLTTDGVDDRRYWVHTLFALRRNHAVMMRRLRQRFTSEPLRDDPPSTPGTINESKRNRRLTSTEVCDSLESGAVKWGSIEPQDNFRFHGEDIYYFLPPDRFEPIASYILRTAGEPTEERLSWLHQAWTKTREDFQRFTSEPLKIPHPLAPIVRAWLQSQTAKYITKEYDRLHPVAVIKHPMGSIREINFVDSDIATLREFATPTRVEQADPNQLLFGFTQGTPSILPPFMPLEISTPTGLKPKTKRGAVSHEIRIFFEALMALEPSQQQADIGFRLGDLINYLYPDGKFHRTNQLPYIIKALETLHFYATVPFRDDQGDLRRWRPVYVKSPLDLNAKNETPVFMRVEMPPDARQGYLIIKDIHRMLGKTSAPQFNAYHTAAWLWDKYGTSKGMLLNLTKPVERRNNEKGLLDANGKPIVNSKGHKITNLYSKDAVRQLPREPNPDAIKRYPVLSEEDLILACMPNGYKGNRRENLSRAKAYWMELKKKGIVSIIKERNGWRIMPSERHLREHRGVREASKKKVY